MPARAPGKRQPCSCGSGKKYKDCCWEKDQRKAASKPVPPWLPSVVLCAVAAYVYLRSQGVHDFAHYAYWVQNDILNGLSTAAFVLAAALALVPPLRRAAVRHLSTLDAAPAAQHVLWVGLGLAGLVGWLCFIRYCEYRAYLLPADMSNSVAAAYGFIHHGTLEYTEWGIKVLSQHFSLSMGIFAPFLLLWNSPLTLLFLEGFFICAVPILAYWIVFRLTSSALAGFVGLLLAMSSPSLYELLTADLNISALPGFFLSAMLALQLRRWGLFALFVAATLTCNEQVPLIYFGLGLYTVYALRERRPWNWLAGAAICAAALAAWAGELAVCQHYSNLEHEFSTINQDKWRSFAHLVPPQTPMARVPMEIVLHPLRTAGHFFSSIYIWYPFLRVLFSGGFLCLLAPFNMLPFLTAVLPHVMTSNGTPAKFFDYHPLYYFDFGLHHPAYMFGPLVWATAYGIRNAYRKLAARNGSGWLLVAALFFAGFGFKYCHRTLNPEFRSNWFDAMPRLAAMIPPHARLWGDEYALSPLALRRWLKNIQWGPAEPGGYQSLFKPDYVLFDKAFIVYAKPPYRDRMLTFWGHNRYRKIAEDSNVVLLKSPDPSPSPEDVPPTIELPPPDPQVAQQYARYILSAPPEKD